jgi:hypothetical protein
VRRLLRILLNALTALSLLLCVAATVRSFHQTDWCPALRHVRRPGTTHVTDVLLFGDYVFFARLDVPEGVQSTAPEGWAAHVGPVGRNEVQKTWVFLWPFVQVDAEHEVLGVGTLKGHVAQGLPVRIVVVPIWYAAILFSLLPLGRGAVVSVRWWRRQRRLKAGRCPRCGYDLRATPDRCPECGAVDAESSHVITGVAGVPGE